MTSGPLPPMWRGETFVLIANGPSLTRAQVAEARLAWIDGEARVLGCNDAYRMAPWIDALYAADDYWWDAHIDAVRKTSIDTLYCCDQHSCEKYGLWHTPVAEDFENCDGLSLDPSFIHGGGHSGFQLLNVALHLGASRILLLGYDCGVTTKTHWFGDHPPSMQKATPYQEFMKFYEQASQQFRELGIEVVNCSGASALAAFPKRSIAACF